MRKGNGVKRRLNSTNFLEFYPATASSPLVQEPPNKLNKNQVELHIAEHCTAMKDRTEKYKLELTKYYDEMLEEFNQVVTDCLTDESIKDLIVTPEILQATRKLLTGQPKGKAVPEIIEPKKTRSIVLPKPEITKKEVLNKISEDPDEDAENVFKKPVGFSRKTRQTSRAASKELQTPKRNNYSKGYNIAKVTPGPNFDRPLSVMRRPNLGEMAVSLNGSPLVTTHDNIRIPQMSIPLSNGRVLTYLANDGLNPDESLCGEIDEETQERLTVFYKLLEKKIKKT